jgi:pyrimidine-nucleoside phosphorylase
MKNIEDARKLAKLMVKIGKQAGRKVCAVLTNMDEPLGNMIGNALEVKEAIDTLHNNGPKGFTQLIKTLAAQALAMGKNLATEEAEKEVENVIANGSALEKFLEMVKIQGGDVSAVKNYDNLPTAEKIVELTAEKSGYISKIHCEEIGLAAMMLGAGRETKEAVIDMAAGLRLLRHVGDEVKAGEVIAEVHVNPEKDNDAAIARIRAAIDIAENEIKPQPLILDIIP